MMEEREWFWINQFRRKAAVQARMGAAAAARREKLKNGWQRWREMVFSE